MASYGAAVLVTAASAHFSGSRHIANAGYIAAALWIASVLSYFMPNVWGVSQAGLWRYAVINFIALIYFYIRWSAQNAQHRTFHFLLMWVYLTTTLFYAYKIWVTSFTDDAFGISGWWYQFLSNILFASVLLLIIGYAIIYRRAQRNKKKYRADVKRGFEKAGTLKENLSKLFDRGPPGNDSA